MAERVRRHRELPRAQRLRGIPGAVYAVGITVVVLISAVVYTLVVARSPRQLEYHVTSLQLNQPGRAIVVYEVYKAQLAEAECTLVAQNVYHEQIGALTQTIGPNNENLRSTLHTAVIPLTTPGQEAVTAFINGCRLTRTH